MPDKLETKPLLGADCRYKSYSDSNYSSSSTDTSACPSDIENQYDEQLEPPQDTPHRLTWKSKRDWFVLVPLTVTKIIIYSFIKTYYLIIEYFKRFRNWDKKQREANADTMRAWRPENAVNEACMWITTVFIACSFTAVFLFVVYVDAKDIRPSPDHS